MQQLGNSEPGVLLSYKQRPVYFGALPQCLCSSTRGLSCSWIAACYYAIKKLGQAQAETAVAGPGAGASRALSAAEPQPEAVSLATMPALVCGLQRPALKLPPSRSGSDTCTYGGVSDQRLHRDAHNICPINTLCAI